MMDKVKSFILPLLCVFVSKMLYFQASAADVCIIACLAVLSAYFHYKSESAALKEMREELNKLKKDVDDSKSHIASIKMSSGFKINAAR